MKKIIFISFLFGVLSLRAADLNILDISAVHKKVQKAVSANFYEWCADCSLDLDIKSKLKNNFIKIGGDELALKQSLCFFEKHKKDNFLAKDDANRSHGISISNQRYITIHDLLAPSSQPRLFLLDLQTGEVQATFSTHGGGQKLLGERDISKDVAQEVSNKRGSNLSPRGFFITGARHSSGNKWKFNMKLYGIQSGINDNTFGRNILMHPFEGVEEKKYSSHDVANKDDLSRALQVMPLSWGCTMIPPAHAQEIIDKIKASSDTEGGSVYYNYSVVEKNYGDKYCGDENLMTLSR